MVKATIRMMIPAKRRGEVLEILSSVAERCRFEPGCFACRVYQDVEVEPVIMLEQLWETGKPWTDICGQRNSGRYCSSWRCLWNRRRSGSMRFQARPGWKPSRRPGISELEEADFEAWFFPVILKDSGTRYQRRISMNSRNPMMLCLLVLMVLCGCARTKITNQERLYSGPLPRPAHIWVYDFAATPADLPADSSLARQYPEIAAPQTAEDIATGRKLGTLIATELVKQIRDMGMPGEHMVAGATAQLNDLIIRGYLISFNEGMPQSVSSSDWGPGRRK